MSENKNTAAGGGNSNTPPTAYHNKSVCIDYFKFRFDINYAEKREKFRKLIYDILKANSFELGTDNGYNYYDKQLLIAPGTIILYGGMHTRNKAGSNTSLLEIKGHGCREFENRYYAMHKDFGIRTRQDIIREGWILLFEECLAITGKCTRIDIPTDDFSGNITIDEIKEKIDKREYTTRIRSLEKNHTHHEEEGEEDEIVKTDKLKGVNRIVDSKLSGYSATFGKREHVQLCIYDKYAEQKKKGFIADADSWVRYEVRYYHENANLEMIELMNALKHKKEVNHIVGCLAGMFEFKEPSNYTSKNLYKAKTWSKWASFIGDVEKRGALSKTPTKNDIQSMISWLKFYCSGALAKSLAVSKSSIAEFVGGLLIQGSRKWTKYDLQIINEARISLGYKPFKSIMEAQAALLHKTDFPSEFSEEISLLILSLKKKK